MAVYLGSNELFSNAMNSCFMGIFPIEGVTMDKVGFKKALRYVHTKIEKSRGLSGVSWRSKPYFGKSEVHYATLTYADRDPHAMYLVFVARGKHYLGVIRVNGEHSTEDVIHWKSLVEDGVFRTDLVNNILARL